MRTFLKATLKTLSNSWSLISILSLSVYITLMSLVYHSEYPVLFVAIINSLSVPLSISYGLLIHGKPWIVILFKQAVFDFRYIAPMLFLNSVEVTMGTVVTGNISLFRKALLDSLHMPLSWLFAWIFGLQKSQTLFWNFFSLMITAIGVILSQITIKTETGKNHQNDGNWFFYFVQIVACFMSVQRNIIIKLHLTVLSRRRLRRKARTTILDIPLQNFTGDKPLSIKFKEEYIQTNIEKTLPITDSKVGKSLESDIVLNNDYAFNNCNKPQNDLENDISDNSGKGINSFLDLKKSSESELVDEQYLDESIESSVIDNILYKLGLKYGILDDRDSDDELLPSQMVTLMLLGVAITSTITSFAGEVRNVPMNIILEYSIYVIAKRGYTAFISLLFVGTNVSVIKLNTPLGAAILSIAGQTTLTAFGCIVDNAVVPPLGYLGFFLVLLGIITFRLFTIE